MSAGTEKRAQSPVSFATTAFSITPNDGADLPQLAYGIMVGGAGDLKIVTKEGDTVVLVVSVSQLVPIIAKKVYATGTDAALLVGLV